MLQLWPCLPLPCPGSNTFVCVTILFSRSLMMWMSSSYPLLSSTTRLWSDDLLVLPPLWSWEMLPFMVDRLWRVCRWFSRVESICCSRLTPLWFLIVFTCGLNFSAGPWAITPENLPTGRCLKKTDYVVLSSDFRRFKCNDTPFAQRFLMLDWPNRESMSADPAGIKSTDDCWCKIVVEDTLVVEKDDLFSECNSMIRARVTRQHRSSQPELRQL